MKEHPILFSTPMVQAILDGRKTMTRRIAKGVSSLHYGNPSQSIEDLWRFHVEGGSCQGHTNTPLTIKCPYGQVGNHLWVRETWCKDLDHNIFYKADNMPPWKDTKWKPSIFMPRSASRITLEITNIRVERLQEISNEDSLSEGIAIPDEPVHFAPREYFKILWNNINSKKYPWSSNPWVWVIEFKKVEKI
jgi:hypothetical protein